VARRNPFCATAPPRSSRILPPAVPDLSSSNRLVVVTGAGGHLGGNLVRELLSRGQRVRAVDLRKSRALEGLDVEWCQADLRDSASALAALSGADLVYHLAAVISITGDPTGQVWATNVGGVANVAQASLHFGVRRLVHCSSVHAFDVELCRGRIDETSPRSVRAELPVYDRSKAAGEAELRKWIEKGLDAVVVNPTGMIGPYDFEPSRMGRLFLTLRAARVRTVVDGAFDWIDVRDVADAMISAAARGRMGESYLLGGHRLSIRELADLIARVTKSQAPRVVVPMAVARVAAWTLARGRLSSDSSPLFTSESLHALMNCPTIVSRKAEVELDHHPRRAEDTLKDIFRWFDSVGLGQKELGVERSPSDVRDSGFQ
jgi:dihydroflavonol-4-reductase